MGIMFLKINNVLNCIQYMDRDIVFIDTCIFKAENYYCKGNRICSFEGLAKDGIISLISTEITRNEIISNLSKDTSFAINQLHKNLKVLRNFLDRSFFVKKTKNEILKESQQIVNNHFSTTNTHVIGYDFCGDVEDVFKKYFLEERPFHEGEKKNEFPDAFVIDALENYCKRFNVQIIVLTTDKDFIKYKSETLVIEQDYKSYLTSKFTEQNILNSIKDSLVSEKQGYCDNIKDKIDVELSNENTYLGQLNTEDVDITIEHINVDIDVDNFSVVGKLNNHYQIEVEADVDFKVKLHYLNLDYAYYDREDSEWYGGEWDDSKIEQYNTFELRFTFSENDGLKMLDWDLGKATRIDKIN